MYGCSYANKNRGDIMSGSGPHLLFLCKPDGEKSMKFNCPKCGRMNVHGVDNNAGHRLSHCDCWEHGYYVMLGSQGLVVKQENMNEHGPYALFLCEPLDENNMTFQCTKCGEEHRHCSSETAGHRSSHCSKCWENGYYVMLGTRNVDGTLV